MTSAGVYLLEHMLVIWIMAALFISSDVRAQTAEDTVAFILFGIEEGTQSNLGGKPWRTDQAGIFYLDFPRMYFRVRRASECEYTADITAASKDRKRLLGDKMIIVTADFAKIHSIKLSSSKKLLIKGLPKAVCEYLIEHNNPASILALHCTNNDNLLGSEFPVFAEARTIVAHIEEERFDAALKYFKGRFCPMLQF
jgi:hypothetical protein